MGGRHSCSPRASHRERVRAVIIQLDRGAREQHKCILWRIALNLARGEPASRASRASRPPGPPDYQLLASCSPMSGAAGGWAFWICCWWVRGRRSYAAPAEGGTVSLWRFGRCCWQAEQQQQQQQCTVWLVGWAVVGGTVGLAGAAARTHAAPLHFTRNGAQEHGQCGAVQCVQLRCGAVQWQAAKEQHADKKVSEGQRFQEATQRRCNPRPRLGQQHAICRGGEGGSIRVAPGWLSVECTVPLCRSRCRRWLRPSLSVALARRLDHDARAEAAGERRGGRCSGSALTAWRGRLGTYIHVPAALRDEQEGGGEGRGPCGGRSVVSEWSEATQPRRPPLIRRRSPPAGAIGLGAAGLSCGAIRQPGPRGRARGRVRPAAATPKYKRPAGGRCYLCDPGGLVSVFLSSPSIYSGRRPLLLLFFSRRADAADADADHPPIIILLLRIGAPSAPLPPYYSARPQAYYTGTPPPLCRAPSALGTAASALFQTLEPLDRHGAVWGLFPFLPRNLVPSLGPHRPAQ